MIGIFTPIFTPIGIIASYFFVGWLVLRLIIFFGNDKKGWEGEYSLKFIVMVFFPIALMLGFLNLIFQIVRNERNIERLREDIEKLKNKSKRKK